MAKTKPKNPPIEPVGFDQENATPESCESNRDMIQRELEETRSFLKFVDTDTNKLITFLRDQIPDNSDIYGQLKQIKEKQGKIQGVKEARALQDAELNLVEETRSLHSELEEYLKAVNSAILMLKVPGSPTQYCQYTEAETDGLNNVCIVARNRTPPTARKCEKLIHLAEYALQHANKINLYKENAKFNRSKYASTGHFVEDHDSQQLLILKDAMNQRFICLYSIMEIMLTQLDNDPFLDWRPTSSNSSESSDTSESSQTSKSNDKNLQTESLSWVENNIPLYYPNCKNLHDSMRANRNKIAHAYGVPDVFIRYYEPFDPKAHWDYISDNLDGLMEALSQIIEKLKELRDERIIAERNEAEPSGPKDWDPNVDGVADIDPWSSGQNGGGSGD